MDTEEQLLSDATRLSAEFATQSAAVEEARRIPPELSNSMAQAGFYRLFIPQSVGGLEVPPAVGSQIFEILAQGDAACAWVAFIAATSGSSLAQIPETAARDIFSRADIHMAGVFAPTGKAERVEGGFRVSGRWQWGSGSQNADWVLGGCSLRENGEVLKNDQGQPANHMMILPAQEIEFLDTWHVSGLRGTGSTDFQVSDVFVPEAHAVGYLDGLANNGALYKFPNFAFLALGIAAVAMGIARASIDQLVQLAKQKKRAGAGRSIADHAHTQMEVARAEAGLRSARAFYYQALTSAWEAACGEGDISVEMRRDLRLATTHAVAASVKVVDAMYTLAGGSAVYESSPLQRHLRDVHVCTQHIMVGSGTLETVGRLYLGLDTNVAML
jgi:alkylation response protein AidB-like acyl-CoA dehydrogenase